MIAESVTTKLPESNAEEIQSVARLSAEKRRERKNRALKSIHKYVVMSTGMGFAPAPLVSKIAVSGILVSMVTELCHEFDAKVSNHIIKTALASILGGAHSGWIAHYSTKRIYTFVPSIGYAANIVARPIAAGAITYAIGRLFLRHLESGAWGR